MERRVHGPNRLTAIRSRIRMKTEYFSIIGSSYHFLYICIIIVLILLFEYEKKYELFCLDGVFACGIGNRLYERG